MAHDRACPLLKEIATAAKAISTNMVLSSVYGPSCREKTIKSVLTRSADAAEFETPVAPKKQKGGKGNGNLPPQPC